MDKQFVISKTQTYKDSVDLNDLSGKPITIKLFDEDFEQDCEICQNGNMVNPCNLCKHGPMDRDKCNGNMKCIAFSRYFEEIEQFYVDNHGKRNE